jgi:hypothetical protein
MAAMITSDIEKKKPNITAEDVKEVGGRIEDKADEGRRGTELQSEPRRKEGAKNLEGSGPGMA